MSIQRDLVRPPRLRQSAPNTVSVRFETFLTISTAFTVDSPGPCMGEFTHVRGPSDVIDCRRVICRVRA